MKPRPLTAFTGINGSGKTASAVYYAWRSGRRVLANVPSSFEKFRTLEDLLNDDQGLWHTDIVFDEAGVIFSSRSRTISEDFLELVAQCRKADARIFWTAPAFGNADKRLREVTQMVVKCRPLLERTPEGFVWPQARYVLCNAFNVGDFDTMSTRVHRDAKRAGFGIVPIAKAGPLFDTLARVSKDGFRPSDDRDAA